MFLIMVVNFWGRGLTIQEARDHIYRLRGKAVTRKEPIKVWYFDPEKFETEDPERLPSVNGMGGLSFMRKEKGPNVQPEDVTASFS